MELVDLIKEADIDALTYCVLVAGLTITMKDKDIDRNEMDLIYNIGGGDLSRDERLIKYIARTDIKHIAGDFAEILNANGAKCVLANMMDFAMADGDVNEQERQMLETFAHKMEIDPEELTPMIQTIMGKNFYKIKV